MVPTAQASTRLPANCSHTNVISWASAPRLSARMPGRLRPLTRRFAPIPLCTVLGGLASPVCAPRSAAARRRHRHGGPAQDREWQRQSGARRGYRTELTRVRLAGAALTIARCLTTSAGVRYAAMFGRAKLELALNKSVKHIISRNRRKGTAICNSAFHSPRIRTSVGC